MISRLVAHRGDMKTYPENSLFALQKSAELGFLYIELDIQLSKDLVPMVIHDDSTKRTTGIGKNIKDLAAKELQTMVLSSSFESNYKGRLLNIATLKDAIELLSSYPHINLFVEIKKESTEYFGVEVVVDQVLKDIERAKINVIIISFVDKVIEYVRKVRSYSTGFVLKKYNKKYLQIAKDLQPDYIFCNIKKINNPTELWKGSWRWVLYDITNPAFAYELLEQGVDLIETGDIVKLSASEYFK